MGPICMHYTHLIEKIDDIDLEGRFVKLFADFGPMCGSRLTLLIETYNDVLTTYPTIILRH